MTNNCSATSNRSSLFIGIEMFRTVLVISPAKKVSTVCTELGGWKSLGCAVLPIAVTLKNENKERIKTIYTQVDTVVI